MLENLVGQGSVPSAVCHQVSISSMLQVVAECYGCLKAGKGMHATLHLLHQ